MQHRNIKDSDQSSVYSTPRLWNSTGSLSQIPQTSHPKNQQIGRHYYQFQDQESSSTQSTGQSHQEVVVNMGASSEEHRVPVQPGMIPNFNNVKISDHVDSEGKRVYSAQKLDYGQSFPCFPYSFADPSYMGGMMTPYGPHSVIHPQMMGPGATHSTRVPLPGEFTEDGPIYVNAKQYPGILRRREARAKLDAKHQLVKGRKPYLHESRHLHAMKRVRGSGGRFLNTKQQKQQQQQQQSVSSTPTNEEVINFSHPAMLQLGGCGLSSRTSGSDVTRITNNGNMLQMQDPMGIQERINMVHHIGGGGGGGGRGGSNRPSIIQ